MSRIRVGKIVNTRGLKGEVRCISLTDSLDRFQELEHVFIEDTGERLEIQTCKFSKGLVYLKFAGYESMSDAEQLKGNYLTIDSNQKKELPENTYYIHDLIGVAVFDETGKHIGEITDVFQTGANDVYEINHDSRMLIPAIKQVVKQVNLNERKMIIMLLDGLLDDI